jgi:hypothetical protein
MPAHKEHQPKERTTAQLWSRRETLKKRRAEIDAEITEIDAKLKAELEWNQTA